VALLGMVVALVLAPAADAMPLRSERATAPADPVLRSIDAALKSKAITLSEAVELRTTWRASARAERNARVASRRSNIHAVRAYATWLARRRGLTATRLQPVFLTIKATSSILGSRRRFPHHEQVVRLPGENDVVFKYYSGRGIQFQPFETFKEGVGHMTAEVPRTGAGRRVADRMLELDNSTRGVSSWEFFFPFGGPPTPWRSAIAQAHALRMYSLVAQAVPEAERAPYLAEADAIVQSYLRSSAGLGVAATEGTGSFYVMYTFNPRQRILNGHLQALLTLHRYWVQTGSPAAKEAYDRGYRALVPIMPKFDTGDWSNYQYGQASEREYHSFMTEQLQDLARETRDPFYIPYARRFRIYLEEPASIGIRVVLLPSLVMPRDGYRDSIPVRFELNKNARTTLIITDGAGMEQRRLTLAAVRGINTISWDGRTATGAQSPDGSYSGRLVAVDRFGRRTTKQIVQSFIIEHDDQAPLPILATLTPINDGTATQVTINVEETASRWFEGQLSINGTPITDVVRVDNGPITFTVARPRDEVATASVRFVDDSGNESTTPLASVLNPSTVSG
jgi:hypothetical protein